MTQRKEKRKREKKRKEHCFGWMICVWVLIWKSDCVMTWGGQCQSKTFFLPTVSKGKGTSGCMGLHGESLGLVRWQKKVLGESISHSLQWRFCRKDKVGQVKQLRTG